MHLYNGFYRGKPLDLFIYGFVWMYIGILVIFNFEVTVSDNGGQSTVTFQEVL